MAVLRYPYNGDRNISMGGTALGNELALISDPLSSSSEFKKHLHLDIDFLNSICPLSQCVDTAKKLATRAVPTPTMTGATSPVVKASSEPSSHKQWRVTRRRRD
jgi:hypothetical protein